MLMKKSLIHNFFIAFSVMILTWLVILSAEIGNLSFCRDDDMAYNAIYNICIFVVTFIFAIFICNTDVVESDFKFGWRRYSMCLPIPPIKSAFVKTIIKIIITLTSFLMQILNYAVICAVSGKSFQISYIMNFLLIIAACLLSDFITTTFMLASKNDRAINLSKASPIVLMIPLLIISRHFFVDIQKIVATFQEEHPDMNSDEMAMDMTSIMLGYIKNTLSNIYVFIIPTITIIFIAGFIINAMIMKRRDK